MAIPDYQSLMLPLLRLASDKQQHKFRDAVEQLAGELRISEAERAEMLPSGTAPLFDNRLGWARTYLKQANLLSSPRRGIFEITERGVSVLAKNPPRIDVTMLDEFAEFRNFRVRKKEQNSTNSEVIETKKPSLNTDSPEDALANAYLTLRQGLVSELIDQLKSVTPSFFERLVVDLLVKMGYGGSRSDAGKAVGRSGDGGIDGVISEDRLGLDVIYIQAKRWESTVGRPEIQKFARALQGQRASKGVFITTSTFTRDAEEYAAVIASKIVLIDGMRLATLMIDNNVGVASAGIYEIKRIDSDYFEE